MNATENQVTGNLSLDQARMSAYMEKVRGRVRVSVPCWVKKENVQGGIHLFDEPMGFPFITLCGERAYGGVEKTIFPPYSPWHYCITCLEKRSMIPDRVSS